MLDFLDTAETNGLGTGATMGFWGVLETGVATGDSFNGGRSSSGTLRSDDTS